MGEVPGYGRENRRLQRETARELAKKLLAESQPTKRPKNRREWIVTIGTPGLLFTGGIGFMSIPSFFWLGVICMYFLAVLAVYDLLRWTEGRTFKIASITAVLVCVLPFTWFVFRPSPLPIDMKSLGTGYSGQAAGIDWQPAFGQVRLEITNPTDRNYEELSAVFEPGVEIMAITSASPGLNVQLEKMKTKADIEFPGSLKIEKETSSTGVRITDQTPAGVVATDPHTGENKVLPISPWANGPSTSYRIKCDKLTKGSTLEIVVAIADSIT